MNHSADVIQYEFELETKLAFLLISIVIYLYILTILESHLLKKSIIRHVNFLWKPTIPEDVLEDRVKKEKQNVELEIYEIENNENLLNKGIFQTVLKSWGPILIILFLIEVIFHFCILLKLLLYQNLKNFNFFNFTTWKQ